MRYDSLDPRKINRLKTWTTLCQVLSIPLGLFCLIFLAIIAGEGFTMAAFLLVVALVLLVMHTISLTLIRKLLTDLLSDPPKSPPPRQDLDMGE